MIVTCEECSTSFSLNDEAIKPSGSKVRCSKCRNVFKVYPAALKEQAPSEPTEHSGPQSDSQTQPSGTEQPAENSFLDNADKTSSPEPVDTISEFNLSQIDDLVPEISDDLDLSSSSTESPIIADTIDFDSDFNLDSDLVMDDLDVSSSSPESSEDTDTKDSDSDFKFDIDFNLGNDFDDSDVQLVESSSDDLKYTLEVDTLSLLSPDKDASDGINDIEALDLTDMENYLDDENNDNMTPISDQNIDQFSGLEDDQFLNLDELDELGKEIPEPSMIPEKTESFQSASSDETIISSPQQNETVIKEPPVEENEEEPAEEPEEEPAYHKKKPSTPILIVLILCLIGGISYGGYVALKTFTHKPPPVQDPGNIKMKPQDISYKFIDNAKTGKLFVITGKVMNEYPMPRSFVKVIGKIFAKDKSVTKSETVFCGNTLSDDDLANSDLAAIQQRLQNKAGDSQSDIKIKTNDVIPFMIVFSNLPDEMDELTMEVVSSDPS